MASAIRKVEFEQPFRYSYSGGFHSSSTIFVAEPSYKHRDVHFKMKTYVSMALSRMQADEAPAEAKPAEPTNPDQSDEVKDEGEKPAAPEPTDEQRAEWTMGLLQTWLPPEKYLEFMAYVQKTLTANGPLCYIETDDGKTVTVREETWESIATNGSLDDLERVIWMFASFFTYRPASPKKSGSGSPSTQGATQTAA